MRKLSVGAVVSAIAFAVMGAEEVDVVIYGSTPGGIAAAVQAKRMGRSVVLLEPTDRIGGLTTGGLGQTDIGNKAAFGGIARSFYADIAKHYAKDENWRWEKRTDYLPDGQCAGTKGSETMWTFEPSAALAVLTEWERREGIRIVRNAKLDRAKGKVKVEGEGERRRIASLSTTDGTVYTGRMFIDATYEGDLMAAAGVRYTVGREANSTYGETLNGMQPIGHPHHNFNVPVDPYVVKGDPKSGLLPGIESEPMGSAGAGDRRVQAYCFRMTLTDKPENRIPFAKPDGYDERDYELLFRYYEAGAERFGLPWINSRMPNRKTDTNNRCGFSTDFIGQNHAWPDASYAERERIFAAHLRYQQGLMWTMANHPRIPKAVRDVYSKWGMCRDEFTVTGGWTPQLYVREARRLVGDYVMTEANCVKDRAAPHPVALAAYQMDSHHVRRYVTSEGHVRNEGDVEVGCSKGPFGIDYGAIVPKRGDCANLFVPVCLSASHIAFGSIRMEPVFFALGQAAGTAAALSVADGCTVQDLDYAKLRTRLLADGQQLPPAAVEFRECPKCGRRIRIDRAAKRAFVNVSRLGGAEREAVAARARELLARATIPSPTDPLLRPTMGWSSWNCFGVGISEERILSVAEAMATNGLKAAGYTYVNIDDGFFWGRAADGTLRIHPERFPNGLKPVVDGIHARGLKAGIYSDAGADTCGSMWGDGATGKDKGGVGAGLYGHDAADCRMHFADLGFDFIKVDFCGGKALKLDERMRYTEIARAIRATGRTDVRFNICRWAFPGTWAADVAGSWRTTEDIRASWKSIRGIVEENLYLSAYASPGHFNDLDMLEVGQLKGLVRSTFGTSDTGLTRDEETAHFGLWCMLSSPLLIGCDVRTIPEETLKLVTNPYLLAMSQNDLGLQAMVAQRDGDACVLVKDADVRFGPSRYVAFYNPDDMAREMTVRAETLGLGGRIETFDLVDESDPGPFKDEVTVSVPPHAAKFYLFEAERRLPRTVYEAESAYLGAYQELKEGDDVRTARPCADKSASGGRVVRRLGGSAANDLVWSEVESAADAEHELVLSCAASEDLVLDVQVDSGAVRRVSVPATAGAFAEVRVTVPLKRGIHRVRLFRADGPAPDVDCMRVRPTEP